MTKVFFLNRSAASWLALFLFSLGWPELNTPLFQWPFQIGPNTLEASTSPPLRVLGVQHELQFAQVPGFQRKNIWIGLEYDLLMDWARENHKRIEFVSYTNPDQAQQDFINGEGDILIGRWSQTLNHNLWLESNPFETTQLGLYCDRENASKYSSKLDSLTEPIFVDRRYFYDFNKSDLGSLNTKKIEYAHFDSLLILDVDTQNRCFVFEERWADFEVKFHRQLKKELILNRRVPLVWKVNPGRPDLRLSLNSWIKNKRKSGHLQRVQSRYYSSLRSLFPSDIRNIEENLSARFRSYQSLFQSSAQAHDVPWTLLAAISYQESHWNNEAVSPTKVRGIMQITRPTALFLGVSDILNVEQTIPAGARYIQHLWSRWPEKLTFRERAKLTLISYNMGYQHVLDVQRWLIRKNKDPYSWLNIVEALKAKEAPSSSSEFELGYARGSEAIKFTERVLSLEIFLRRAL
jgi:membrane-bound lytic murein transglycosylase F